MNDGTCALALPCPTDANPGCGHEYVSIPRVALQMLAELAYPTFGWDTIWGKLPPRNPRRASWRIDDDLHRELEKERMAYLKEKVWEAHCEASRREEASGAVRDHKLCPALAVFAECLAEMESADWSEPLSKKDLERRKKKIRTRKAEIAEIEHRMENPTPEKLVESMQWSGDLTVYAIEKHLGSNIPEIQAKAREEVPRLIAALQALQDNKA